MQLDIPPRRSKQIGLTPLIDVVFILLLFFMLSTQFSQQNALMLNVPASEQTTGLDTDSNTLSIDLQVDGTAIIDGTAVTSIEQLQDNEQLRTALLNQYTVWIDADDLVSLQALISLSDQLSALGFDNINLSALQ